MKLLAVALFVVAMTALTTAYKLSIENPAPEEPAPENPTPENPTPENPTPEEPTPEDPTPENLLLEIPLDETTKTDELLQSAGKVRQKRQTQDLQWVNFDGNLPVEAVSIYNSERHRDEYVCKNGCDSGFYTPSKGSYCFNPYGGKEHRSSQFEILVNSNNQILEWKSGAYGSVPSNSVRTCLMEDIYVGKNRYGLGKVHARHDAFFIAKDGKEEWYKWYDVLTF